jgi:hypothetical protein
MASQLKVTVLPTSTIWIRGSDIVTRIGASVGGASGRTFPVVKYIYMQIKALKFK